MPRTVILFERLGYLSLFIGLLSGYLNQRFTSLAEWVAAAVFVVGLNSFFIWLVARKRKKWARLLWLSLVFWERSALCG
jgi:hypothetical protein